jgi:putative solute:sodium symporter small subunit
VSQERPPLRTPSDELADATAHGGVYLRRLVRAQLTLSLVALVAFGGILGSLPLALLLVGRLQQITIGGIPVADLLVAIPPFPLFVVIGWLYRRRADALDDSFRTLVRGE